MPVFSAAGLDLLACCRYFFYQGTPFTQMSVTQNRVHCRVVGGALRPAISLTVLVFISLCSWNAVAEEGAAGTILALEKKWNDVYKQSDVAAMDSLLADDFIITVEDGKTFSKPGFIAHNGNSTLSVAISDMSDLRVRMHGNTAVVTGAYHERGTDAGKPYDYADRLTDVWMKMNGKWRLIASHYSLRVKP